jgi:protein-tyrosine kinase
MERIQAAIQKAKEQRGTAVAAAPAGTALPRGAARPAPVGPVWGELAAFEPDARLLARNHIVTFEDVDPVHSHFDILRTKVLRTMRRSGWTTLGITSPTSGCGKTTLALNLAFSLAHQAEMRTVLVDLDLRRPAVAHELELPGPRSVGKLMRGDATLAETFLRYGDNLAIAGNSESMRHSGDLLMSAAATQAAAGLKAAFAPDVILYDLPPMLMSDDALAFLPHLDCVLLVAGAEKSNLDEVDKCERELAENTNLLGVVLNMCRYMGEDYGYY